MKCNRFIVELGFLQLGNLLKKRVYPTTKTIQNAGLDFPGPLLCEIVQKIVEKVYMAFFFCFASKAVHIEAVTNMATPGCIAALRKFVSCCSYPTQLSSDNGSRFNDAKSELLAIQKKPKANYAESLQAEVPVLNIDWNVLPPRAPLFGGLWESSTESAKRHTRNIMGNRIFSFEKLTIFWPDCAIFKLTSLKSKSGKSEWLKQKHQYNYFWVAN